MIHDQTLQSMFTVWIRVSARPRSDAPRFWAVFSQIACGCTSFEQYGRAGITDHELKLAFDFDRRLDGHAALRERLLIQPCDPT
jgi:hypothetical protein